MFRQMRDEYLAMALTVLVVSMGLWLGAGQKSEGPSSAGSPTPFEKKAIRGIFQARPGGPMEEVEVDVTEVPVDLPSVAAAEAAMEDDELVVGVVVNGEPMAYPVRYLALHEVVDHRAGKLPVAPTW